MNTEKSSNFGMDYQLRVTLKDLQNSINRLVKNKQVSETATILWAKTIEPGTRFNSMLDENDFYIIPGTVLLGLEWTEDGEVNHGTMRIEPPIVGSKYIN